jgi:hypothetical protein
MAAALFAGPAWAPTECCDQQRTAARVEVAPDNLSRRSARSRLRVARPRLLGWSCQGRDEASGKLERLAARLKQLARDGGSDRRDTRLHTVDWVLEARQVRRAAELDSAIEAAGTLYACEPLHVVRVAIKKLRYALEAAERNDRVASKAVRDLAEGQEVLGRLHDLEVLLIWVRRTQAAMERPALSEWREFSLIVRGIENDCRREHAHYMRLRSGVLAIADRVADRHARRRVRASLSSADSSPSVASAV